MLNSRFGYSVKKNSFKGLNIDQFQYSNNVLFVFVFRHNSESKYYSYSYSVKILIPNIIRLRIRSKKQYSLTSV